MWRKIVKIFNNPLKNASSKRIFILIILLLLLSLPPRLLFLSSLPPLIVDEPAYLRDINLMQTTNNYNPASPQWDGSQAYLDYYPALGLILMGVDELLSLRIISVLYSLLGVIFLLLIVRHYTNTYIGFLTGLLFSYSYFFLEFSRVGWNVIHAVVLGMGTLFFVILSCKHENRTLYTFLAGLLSVLCFYTYRSGEIYIACCVLVYIIELLRQKKASILLSFIIYLDIFLIFSFPWILYILGNLKSYLLRGDVVSIVHVELPYRGVTSTVSVFIYQIITTGKTWILMLPIFDNGGHIENTRYLPLIFPIISIPLIPLFWGGLILLLKKISSFYPWVFIFIVGLITSQILTVFPPNGARGLILLPVIYLAIGMMLAVIQNKFKNKVLINSILLILSIVISIIDVTFYFYWMSWIVV